MIYAQLHDSARENGLLTDVFVLPKETARTSFCRADPSLSNNALQERYMPLTHTTPGVRPAQEFTDPLIVNARLVNLAAEIERNLAARRALRPARSAAARLGWERRK